MKQALFASVVVGAALFAATASFAQTMSGPQYPYPTSSQQLGVGAYGQVGVPAPEAYGSTVTGQHQVTRPRMRAGHRVIGEPAPAQESD